MNRSQRQAGQQPDRALRTSADASLSVISSAGESDAPEDAEHASTVDHVLISDCPHRRRVADRLRADGIAALAAFASASRGVVFPRRRCGRCYPARIGDPAARRQSKRSLFRNGAHRASRHMEPTRARGRCCAAIPTREEASTSARHTDPRRELSARHASAATHADRQRHAGPVRIDDVYTPCYPYPPCGRVLPARRDHVRRRSRSLRASRRDSARKRRGTQYRDRSHPRLAAAARCRGPRKRIGTRDLCARGHSRGKEAV